MDTIKPSGGTLGITFIGHASLALSFAGTVIHLDPWGQLADYTALPPADLRIVACDFGIKWNILRSLRRCGMDVTVVPAGTDAATVLGLKPDGVFLSNGPADPAALTYAIRTARELLGKVPLMVGDVLLVQGPEARLDDLRTGGNVLVLSDVSHFLPEKKAGGRIVLVFVLALVLGGAGVLPLRKHAARRAGGHRPEAPRGAWPRPRDRRGARRRRGVCRDSGTGPPP